MIGTMTGGTDMVGGGLEMVEEGMVMVGIIGRPQWARAGTRGVTIMRRAAVVIGGTGTMTGDMGMVGGGLEMVGIIGRPQGAGTRGGTMVGVTGALGQDDGLKMEMMVVGLEMVEGAMEMVAGMGGN